MTDTTPQIKAYTSNHDYLLVTNHLGETVPVSGKQIVTLLYLVDAINQAEDGYLVLTRSQLREELDKKLIELSNNQNHPANPLVIKLKSMFSGRGEFSNSLKSMIDKHLIVERKVGMDRHHAIFRYSVNQPLVILKYVEYEPEVTYRSKKNPEKRAEYNKAYHDKNRELINYKKRMKYASNKLKEAENNKKQLDKHSVKVAKLREKARLKEEKRLKAIRLKEERKLLKTANKPAVTDINQSQNNTSPLTPVKVVNSLIKVVGSLECNVEKPVIMSEASSTTRDNQHYRPYQIPAKYKTRETYIHGALKAPSPNAKTPPPRREIKPRYVTKKKIAAGNKNPVTPYELEDMIKDFIGKGNKIKVYDQVSEDIKAVVKGHDRKVILDK